jgi:hypothetical protein
MWLKEISARPEIRPRWLVPPAAHPPSPASGQGFCQAARRDIGSGRAVGSLQIEPIAPRKR